MLEINKIYNEDCLSDNGLKLIQDKSIDLILCDLPYGTTRNKWDSIIPLDQLWTHYKRIIKDNGAIVLTAQTPFDKILGCSNIEWLRYEWIWEKTSATGHLNAKKMPMKAHENVLVFYKNLPTYNPQKTYGHVRKVSKAEHKRNSKMSTNYNEYGLTTYDSTERYPRSVVKFANDKQKEAISPTQKPIALFRYLIRTFSNEGELILDNCSGSGTTAIACLNENRKYICLEKDVDEWKKSINRLNNYINKQITC